MAQNWIRTVRIFSATTMLLGSSSVVSGRIASAEELHKQMGAAKESRATIKAVKRKTSHASLQGSAEEVSVQALHRVNSALSERTQVHSTTSVQVVSSEQLKQTGQSNVMAALEQLSPSLSSPSFSGLGTNGFVRTMQLRNLSADETLILVNGKRRHLSANFNSNDGPNAGTEPSDIALIPISAIDHVEVITDGASALYGQEAIAGAVNIVLKRNSHGGEFNIQNMGYYAGDGQGVDGSADYGLELGKRGGFMNLAGQITHTQPTNRSGIYQKAGDPQSGQDLNRMMGAGSQLVATMSANAEMPVTDTIKAYLLATYAHRNNVTPQSVRTAANVNNILQYYPNGFQPQMGLQEDDFQINGGFRGTAFKDWMWDTYVTYGRDEQEYSTLDSVNATYGMNSQTKFYDGTNISTQFVAGGKMSRNFNVGFLPKPVNLMFGGEYRHDTFQLMAGDLQSWSDGGLKTGATPGASGHPGAQPAAASDTSRDIFDGFVNTEFYVTPKWEWTLGGHAVNYSDMGKTAATGTIGTRYNFNKRWAIRANVGTGYRAPTLGQENYYIVTTFPGYSTAQLPANGAAAKALGATGLKGETTKNYSVGFDAKPLDHWNVNANLYCIQINNRMANSTQFTEYNGSPIASILSQYNMTNVTYAHYYGNPVNTVTYGGDITTDYTLDVGRMGQLKFNLGINFSDTEISKMKVSTAMFNAYAQNLLLHSAPKNREMVGVRWSWKKLSIFVQEERYGSVTYIATPSLSGNDWLNVKPGYITDLEVGYQVLDRLHLAVGANNLFNYYPNQLRRSLSVSTSSGAYKYPTNSPYGFMGGYYYVKASMTF
ncbi:TonB-dependent receptor plug domain-containing protein [Acetobacter okinawensis]|uniref:TonB-dependent receptor plug domain-containing protein n=1 Tax=Acetobacter okinawensis TaxID=1076594 RepID=UPI0039ECD8DA